MKVVSLEHTPARNVAKGWREVYYRNGRWGELNHGSSEIIYNMLLAVGDDADRDVVAKVIGNKSWSHISCHCCDDYILRGVSMGVDEYGDLIFCDACIAEAYQLLSEYRDD